jgi:hypothetical protein
VKHRLTAIATTGAIVSALIFAPLSVVKAQTSSKLPTNILVAAAPNGNLLQNVPISYSTTLADGRTFVANSLSVTQLNYQNGQLLVSGVLKGTLVALDGTTTTITQTLTNIVATLTGGGNPNVCDILFLDLGPISLDLLGLTIDLSQITLDVNAVAGSGNLLGNLLCALVGLLDQGGALAGITNIINQINSLL